jgi:glutaredoxin 3
MSSTASVTVSETIKRLIADNIVMVFSKSFCPYCMKAKRVLEGYPLKSYKVLELDSLKDGDEYQDVLQSMTGMKS